jgi:hypothetical protein
VARPGVIVVQSRTIHNVPSTSEAEGGHRARPDEIG